MILFRALNQYDIMCDPLKCGLPSKKLLYEVVHRYYQLDKKSKSMFLNFSDVEREEFVKRNIDKCVSSHVRELEKIFSTYSLETKNVVKRYAEFLNTICSLSSDELNRLSFDNSKDNIDFGSCINLIKYLSTLQQHLLYGSTKFTDWISFSTSLQAIMRYYDRQKIHSIAVISSETTGIYDSDYIMSVDVSTFENIKKNMKYLCNKVDIHDEFIFDVFSQIANCHPLFLLSFINGMVVNTNINSRGFKYSVNSKEVCLLRYVPKDKIISLLEALHIELARYGMFNSNFIFLSLEEQKRELNRLKFYLLEKIRKQNDQFLLFLFDELYMKNKNIYELISFDRSEEYIENGVKKIMKLAHSIPSSMIKK